VTVRLHALDPHGLTTLVASLRLSAAEARDMAACLVAAANERS